ncbi:MAG: hypothetical protein H0W03_06820 [Solirubrobacterales bacterium]|jgi:hypothetical protein|nr:hypothetical protein [Solirubrobacterales bacterium]
MTLRDWLEDHPPPDAAFTQTLAGVAGHTRHNRELFFPAVRELLDELALTYTDDQRRRAIAEEPATTGDRRFDAYLGALSEHLAIRYELAGAAMDAASVALSRPLLVRQSRPGLSRHRGRPVPRVLPPARHLHRPRLPGAVLI